MADKPTFAQVITSPGFKFLWANQILTQLATNALNFTLLIWVFKLTNSNFSVSILMLSIILPAILLGVFAGVIVDASDRKKIILTTDLILSLLFASLIFFKEFFGAIIAISFLINTTYQFFTPAEASSIPMLVDKKKLLLANSLFQTTLFGSVVVGYSLAGPFINFFSIDSIFIAGSLAIFVGFLLSQNLPQIAPTKSPQNKQLVAHLSDWNFDKAWQITWREIKQTFVFIRGKLSVAVAIGVLAGVQGMIGILAVLISSYMEQVMHIRATDASYILMFPLGAGMVVGSFLIGRFGHNIPKRVLVTRGILIAGIALILVGIAPMVGRAYSTLDLSERLGVTRRPFLHAPNLSTFLAFISFILGIATVAIIVPSQTLLQESTPEHLRGKIFAVLAVLMSSFASLPVILAGGLADIFGVLPVLIGAGAVIIFIGSLGYKPAFFFAEHHLPFRVREFLGLGHWEEK